MNNDIRNLLSVLDNISEGAVTPVAVKSGLNQQQKSVPQLPALFKPKDISPVLGTKKDPKHPMDGYMVGDSVENDKNPIEEVHTTEDVISTVKKKLGDYLQDVASAIKKDPDLINAMPNDIDKIGPAVKTITTHDGHEIRIHGNEDDGFRITVKNKPHSAKFKNLDEAVIACEMFCSQRKVAESSVDPDYMEER